VIYLDASALVKLVFEEPESAALEQWVSDRSELPKLTGELSTVELVRTCRRLDEGAVADARRLLAGLDLLPMASAIVEEAALAGPALLRSLDAIHLASALSVREGLIAFVTYDARLAAAAASEDLPLVGPT
jgi:uncharacterized protein